MKSKFLYMADDTKPDLPIPPVPPATPEGP
jgi:hypothetical protein